MGLFNKLKNLVSSKKNTVKVVLEKEEKGEKLTIEELKDALILSDVSANVADKICKNIKQGDNLRSQLIEAISSSMKQAESVVNFIPPCALIFLGVNGSGKTTILAKMSNKLSKQGKKVTLCGTDTFRAAAHHQLAIWADRIGIESLIGKEGEDPSSVLYKGLDLVANNKGYLLVDTSGRQPTYEPLMEELRKMQRVISKIKDKSPELRTYNILVLDALLGQNVLKQIEDFDKVMPLDSIIMNKLDSTAKGGTLIEAIEKFGLPIQFIGTGEQIDDLELFNAKDFASALCGLDKKIN